MPRQVEFTNYSLNTWPPEPREVRMVTPIYASPDPREALSDHLLYVSSLERRMGYLATDNWLDIDRFKMATGRPEEKDFFRQPASDIPQVYRRLRSRYHMRCATSVFKAICLSPDVMPEVDVPRTEMGNGQEFSRTVTEYLRETSIYQPAGNSISLNNLLVSQAAVTNFTQKVWHASVFGPSVGKKQRAVLRRLYEQPLSPYTSSGYDFDI